MPSSTASWQVTSAVVQGVSHQKMGLPCQDALDFRFLPGGVLLAALSDGAGSAARAEEGATLAVESCLAALADILETETDSLEALSQAQKIDPVFPLWGAMVFDAPGDLERSEDDRLEALLISAFASARQALVQWADEQGLPLRDYAATLTCVIASPERLAVASLGDSMVVYQNASGELIAGSRSQRGEYANETYFLTQDDALDNVQVSVRLESACILAMMSDGLTRLALNLPSGEPHAPFFKPLFAFAASLNGASELAPQSVHPEADEHLAAFLASERVCARTDDDKSLLLAVRRADSPSDA